MNPVKLDLPDLDDVSIVFSVQKASPELLAEAKLRGFYNGNTPYNNLFSQLFYKGGRLTYKSDLDPVFKTRATRYLWAVMRSFNLKHEEKEAICALLLSELAEVSS